MVIYVNLNKFVDRFSEKNILFFSHLIGVFMKYVGAIDQGTTSTRFILFDRNSKLIASHQMEHKQIFTQAGFVEHDPLEIWENTKSVILQTLKKTNIKEENIATIGVTNQRETTVIWNKKTGKPYHNAIVWQDTRTAKICQNLQPKNKVIQNKTGLPLATYFSAPKIKWLLQNLKNLETEIQSNNILFGTIDSWIVWNLTGGKNGGIHITDVTNASRTMLMNLETLNWDEELLAIFDIPKNILPKICSSSEIYGKIDFLKNVPLSGILGDQQAALFGQACFQKGDAKNTYGTGCFLLLNTGNKIVHSKFGLLTTVGYKIGKQPAIYALEGAVALAGSLVQWLRDNFGLIEKSEQVTELATTVEDNGGVYFVPAFSGIFAPYWNNSARGTICGLTHFSNKGHIARAVLEATAFQTKEVFDAMQKDAKIELMNLKVDGGMTVNNLLMQFQADLLDIELTRPKITETTALGVAYAAGLAVGFWQNVEELENNWQKDKSWQSNMTDKKRQQFLQKWQKAVKKSLHWEE